MPLYDVTVRRASDKVCSFISIMPISSSNPMFYDLLESSQRDDSNKWSNIAFVDEKTHAVSIEINSICSSAVRVQ